MRKRLGGFFSSAAALVVMLAGIFGVGATPAQASVAVLLEQPYGRFGFMNPTGHAAVYLDHVCADGPLHLRPCLPGEMGVVISRYDGVGNHDWIAIPLIPYLYAVNSVEQIPAWADRPEVEHLRDQYRRAYLENIAPDLTDGQAPAGNWYELVGSAYDRTIYGFRVKTTPEQDARIIALFNDLPNTEHYNGAFRNCADFVRTTVNRYYPHAIRRNFIADLGMTTPKTVARDLAHYAHKHPQTDLQVFVIPQVKGTLPRSHAVEGVAESLIKKYGLPLVFLSPTTAAVTLAAYIGDGRFAMPKDPPVLALHDPPMTTASLTTSEPLTVARPPSSTLLNRKTNDTASRVATGNVLGVSLSVRTGGISLGTP